MPTGSCRRRRCRDVPAARVHVRACHHRRPWAARDDSAASCSHKGSLWDWVGEDPPGTPSMPAAPSWRAPGSPSLSPTPTAAPCTPFSGFARNKVPHHGTVFFPGKSGGTVGSGGWGCVAAGTPHAPGRLLKPILFLVRVPRVPSCPAVCPFLSPRGQPSMGEGARPQPGSGQSGPGTYPNLEAAVKGPLPCSDAGLPSLPKDPGTLHIRTAHSPSGGS